MVTYTSAFLAVANLLALAHAAPQPVCFAVTTVITGSPIWVPRAAPTTGSGWGPWSSQGSSSSVSTTGSGWGPWSSQGSSSSVSTTTRATTTSASTTARTTTVSKSRDWTTSSTTIPLVTITVTPSSTTAATTTSDITTTTTTTTTTTAATTAPAAPTCKASGVDYFSASPAGACGCEFAVSCNRHAPYTQATKFWERTSGEVINSLQECQNICNENSECTAAIWVNDPTANAAEYLHCWQTSGLPKDDTDGYGQISYKGSCSGSCSGYIN